MTRQKLGQAYRLQRELDMWQSKLSELRQSSYMGSPSDSKEGHANGISDKTFSISSKEIEIIEITEALKLNVEKQILEIEKYIETLDDTFLRQIIEYRCVRMFGWDKVASMIGMGTSAESCRKYFERKIPKK